MSDRYLKGGPKFKTKYARFFSCSPLATQLASSEKRLESFMGPVAAECYALKRGEKSIARKRGVKTEEEAHELLGGVVLYNS